MPRNLATTVENNFVLGLITERTELRFPQNASTDLDNCQIDLYGRISRRKGIDLEENYEATTVTSSTDGAQVYTEFLWEGSGGTSDQTFLVVQNGSTLMFYDMSGATDVGPSLVGSTIDLTDYIPSGSTLDPAGLVCDFAAGNGKLLVVNGAIEPIYITFTSGQFEATQVTVNIRDFEGLDDGLDLVTRPTASVSGLASSNPEHYYNILNQGWYTGDALSQWDSARTDMPSNSDQASLYRASATDAFDNAIVTARTPGNVAAPKGHFILNAFNPNRSAAALAEGYVVTVDAVSEVDRTTGTAFSQGWTNASNAFDTNTDSYATIFAQGDTYLGMSFSSATTVAAISATVYANHDLGNVTFKLRASNTSPSNPDDGTELGNITVNMQNGKRIVIGIASNNLVSTYKYIWLQDYTLGAGVTRRVYDFHIYDEPPVLSSIIFNRPQSVAFFQGRAFYSGVSAPNLSTKIYFSRIIENDTHYGQCYSDNDPTSETFNDFLPSDGGVISIPDCGTVIRLFPTQSSLLVLATNGIWVIGGTTGTPFQASNYNVSKLSSIGTQCPRSIADYKGTPIWWGDNGIYTVQYDPNFNSYTVVDMTQDNIRTFYNNINASSRRITKGAYDIEQDTVYFLYQDVEDASTLPPNVYNRVLVFVPRSKAFYPWTFEDSDFYIRGFIYTRSASRSTTPIIKYLATDISTDTDLYFAEISNDSYKDWTTYASVIANDPSKEINYTSYFTVGHYIHGETQRFFQGNYLFVFLDQDTQGSVFVQTLYDWTTSGNSGKWGARQQAYPDWQLLQSVNYRRLKTRGKGRAMQLYFESEEGKPFSVIGWSILESGNAGI